MGPILLSRPPLSVLPMKFSWAVDFSGTTIRLSSIIPLVRRHRPPEQTPWPECLRRYRQRCLPIVFESTNRSFPIFKIRGLRGGEVRAFAYYAAAYQAIMRTSIRDRITVSQRRSSFPTGVWPEYLHDIFRARRSRNSTLALARTHPKAGAVLGGAIRTGTGSPNNVKRPESGDSKI